MFGIVYLLGQLIASVFADVKEQYEDYKSKQDCKQIDIFDLTYINSKGQQRFKSNDHPVFTQFDHDKGTIKYIDMKNQRAVAEYVPPERQKARDQIIKKCEAMGCTVLPETTVLFDCCNAQHVYRDIYTNQRYVVRKIRDRYYYITWKHGQNVGSIVRETDRSKKLIQEGDGVHPEEMRRDISLQTCETERFPEVSYDYRLCEKYS